MIERRSMLAVAAGWTIVGASAVRAQSWPERAGQDRGALHSRWRYRHGGPLSRRKDDGSARSAGDRRGSTPEAYLEKRKFETERWTKVGTDRGIKVEG